jgi:Zn-dependent membrane protease YugP
MFFYDWTILLVLPGLLLALAAQAMVGGTFSKYQRVPARSGLTGAALARRMLDSRGLTDVAVERVSGKLSDHYDPSNRVLRLSDGVYGSASVAALGVAAHETGHALQDLEGYAPLKLRTAIVPAVGFGSNLSWPIFLVGLIFSWEPLLVAGIVLFALAVAFSLITLPVEFNASRRALAALSAGGYLMPEEIDGASKVLRAASMTYVAAAVGAILQLLRLLLLAGNSRRRN